MAEERPVEIHTAEREEARGFARPPAAVEFMNLPGCPAETGAARAGVLLGLLQMTLLLLLLLALGVLQKFRRPGRRAA